MFTVATIMFEKATGLTMLHSIPLITICMAWVAWTATFVGMLRSLPQRGLRAKGTGNLRIVVRRKRFWYKLDVRERFDLSLRQLLNNRLSNRVPGGLDLR